MNDGNVDFDNRNVDCGDCVGDSQRCVGICSGIEDYSVKVAETDFMKFVDNLALVVTLKVAERYGIIFSV